MTRRFKKEVDSIVKQLVNKYRPEKVILFGSAAHGEMTDESDLDLFILKQTKKNYHDRVVAARGAFDTDLPVDLVVLTPKELQKAIDEKDFLFGIFLSMEQRSMNPRHNKADVESWLKKARNDVRFAQASLPGGFFSQICFI